MHKKVIPLIVGAVRSIRFNDGSFDFGSPQESWRLRKPKITPAEIVELSKITESYTASLDAVILRVLFGSVSAALGGLLTLNGLKKDIDGCWGKWCLVKQIIENELAKRNVL